MSKYLPPCIAGNPYCERAREDDSGLCDACADREELVQLCEAICNDDDCDIDNATCRCTTHHALIEAVPA